MNPGASTALVPAKRSATRSKVQKSIPSNDNNCLNY